MNKSFSNPIQNVEIQKLISNIKKIIVQTQPHFLKKIALVRWSKRCLSNNKETYWQSKEKY